MGYASETSSTSPNRIGTPYPPPWNFKKIVSSKIYKIWTITHSTSIHPIPQTSFQMCRYRQSVNPLVDHDSADAISHHRIQDTFTHCNHTYLLVRLISPLRLSIVEPFCSPTKWSQHFYRVPIDCWHWFRSIVPTDFAGLVQTTQPLLQKSAVQTARRPVGSSKNPHQRLMAYGLTLLYISRQFPEQIRSQNSTFPFRNYSWLFWSTKARSVVPPLSTWTRPAIAAAAAAAAEPALAEELTNVDTRRVGFYFS